MQTNKQIKQEESHKSGLFLDSVNNFGELGGISQSPLSLSGGLVCMCVFMGILCVWEDSEAELLCWTEHIFIFIIKQLHTHTQACKLRFRCVRTHQVMYGNVMKQRRRDEENFRGGRYREVERRELK